VSTAPFTVICSSHDRPKWLADRVSGIGASEIAGVLGESPWASPLSVYQAKVAPSDDEQAEHQFWGLELEGSIAAGFSKRTGRPHTPAGHLLRSTEYPWAICTLDCWTISDPDRPTHPLEIKNVIEWMADEWEGGAPRHVYLQAQHQMLVTATHRATVAALLGGNQLLWEDVERNEQEIRRITAQGERFWREHVEARVQPPADDAHRATKAALLRLHPHDDGQLVTLPSELCDLDVERMELKERIKRDEQRVEQIDNMIKQRIGDATEGRLPGGVTYTWKEQTRAAHMVRESTTRVLRRKAG